MAAAASLAMACTAQAGAPASKLEPLILPTPPTIGPAVQPYIKVSAKRIALTHVRIIDGTGSAELTDRTIVIEDGKILSIGASTDPAPAGATPLVVPRSRVICAR